MHFTPSWGRIQIFQALYPRQLVKIREKESATKRNERLGARSYDLKHN